MKAKLIKDTKGNFSITTFEVAEVTPQWLAMQKTPFAADTEFVRAYPFDGGSMVVDAKRVEVLRNMSDKDLAALEQANPWDVAERLTD